MARNRKNKKIIAIILSVVFIVSTIALGTVALLQNGAISLDVMNPNVNSSSPPEVSNSLPPIVEVTNPESSSQPENNDNLSDQTQNEVIQTEYIIDFQNSELLAPMFHNFVSDMRGVYLIPGVDFIKNAGDTEETIKSQIDEAVASALELTINTLIVDTKYRDSVIYKSNIYTPINKEFDILDYIIEVARKNNMSVYTFYDILNINQGDIYNEEINNELIDGICNGVYELVANHDINGILLDDYYNIAKSGSFSVYMNSSAGMSYEDYMLKTAYTTYKKTVLAARAANRNIQIGLVTDEVWANEELNAVGSETNADFQTLIDGNADTLKYIEDMLADFVMVKAYGSTKNDDVPFKTVVQWWDEVATSKEIPLYVIHAVDKSCTDEEGWNVPDELSKQVLILQELDSLKGSVFNSLTTLIENPKESVAVMIKSLEGEVKLSHISKTLAITNPTKTTFTTYEPEIVFTGASDPNFQVLFDGEKIEQNQNGYFQVAAELTPGKNKFTFSHKEKDITFNIERKVKVVKEVSPTGSLSVQGETDITISVLAYKDSVVTAKLGNKTVTLEVDEDTTDDDAVNDSNYIRYTGTITAPAATKSVQKLGNIVVSGNWNGFTDSETGASVQVNKKLEMGSGALIQVSVKSAETFPTNVINDYSNPDYHPLPKGTVDRITSQELSYTDSEGKNFKYYILNSGVRVYSKDISVIEDSELEDNMITDMSVSSDNNYTYVTLTTDWKVPYTVSANDTKFSINFKYSGSNAKSISSCSSPLISSAQWNSSTLNLSIKNNGLVGYTAYYNSNDQLVFRFTHPPGMSASSLAGIRIYIDPGHSDSDPGAIGYYPGLDEREINRAIANKVVSKLRALGATVMLGSTPSKITLQERMESARNFEPHLLLSLHSNSSVNKSVRGTEVYYFNQYSKSLASYLSSGISSSAGTSNRGAKFGYFYMTREFAFPCCLVEYAFVSNLNDYNLLISDSGQNQMAQGTVNGIINYFSSKGGSSATPPTTSSGNQGDNSNQGTSSETQIQSLAFSQIEYSVEVGKTVATSVSITPASAEGKKVIYSSSNPAVLTIDETGKITGVAEGTAQIYVSSENGMMTYANVTVTEASSENNTETNDNNNNNTITGEGDISLPSNIILEINAEVKLTPIIAPDDLADKTIIWSSSDSSIVSVDENGILKTNTNGGKVTITATLKSSGKTATCEVEVLLPPNS